MFMCHDLSELDLTWKKIIAHLTNLLTSQTYIQLVPPENRLLVVSSSCSGPHRLLPARCSFQHL